MINCKNCEHSFEGNFCPNCGQKVINKRFNLKDSISWLLNSIFNLDHGFAFTTKELIINPGYVVRSVLNGVTIRYTHPFRLLFVWATLSTLLTLLLGTYDEQTAEIGKSLTFSEQQMEFQRRSNEFMKKYLNFIIMANVPLISLISLLFYKKKGYNFTEHLVLNSYGYSMTTAIGVILIFAQTLAHMPTLFMWLSMLLNVLLMGYVYASFFKENYVIASLKYLFAFLFSYLMAIIFFIIVLFIIVLIHETTGVGVNPFKPEASVE